MTASRGRRRLIVEADGGSRGNPGQAGCGALVRDGETGEVLAEVGESLGVASNNVAEYGGLVAGLRAAVALDAECVVEVRMDSRLVIEQMSGRWQIRHEDMRRMAARARAVLPPARVEYVWISRSQNARADALANRAMDGLPVGDSQEPGAAPAPSVPPDLGEPTTLLLVRHGSTIHTQESRVSGSGTDPGLSDRGRVEVAALASALVRRVVQTPAPPTPVCVVTSPSARARETGAILAEALAVPIESDPAWAELRFGEWEGLTYAEIAERSPALWRRWQSSPAEAPPGGESLDDAAARVLAAREALVAAHPQTSVIVVTHVAPIRTLVRDALGAGPESLWRVRVDPASVTTIRRWPDGGVEIGALNATAHLTATT